MVPNTGIDTTANVTPYLGCLRDAGVTFICRYLNPLGVSVGLSRREGIAITRAGLSIVALFEWGTISYTRSYFTYARGQSDARLAFSSAKNIGVPAGRPIYFTVDMDATAPDLPAIGAYFHGVHDELLALGRTRPTYLVGAYGSYRTLSYLRSVHAADYLFQTYAWSGGQVLAGVNLLQEEDDTHICGFANDRDVSWGDGGGFEIL